MPQLKWASLPGLKDMQTHLPTSHTKGASHKKNLPAFKGISG